jgi:hypothetical protein
MSVDHEPYTKPDDVRDAGEERADGRPTGAPAEGTVRSGQDPATAPTEPVEEHGHQPATEHSPGGDL